MFAVKALPAPEELSNHAASEILEFTSSVKRPRVLGRYRLPAIAAAACDRELSPRLTSAVTRIPRPPVLQ